MNSSFGCNSTTQRREQNDTFVQQSLDLKLESKRARYCLKWLIISLCILLLLIWDLDSTCVAVRWKNLWYVAEFVAACLMAISCCAYFLRYMLFVLQRKFVKGTEMQRYLLDIADNDASFVLEDLNSADNRNNTSAVHNDKHNTSSEPYMNWHSSFNNSHNRSFGRSSSGRISPNRMLSYANLSPQQQQQQLERSNHNNTSYFSGSNNNSAYNVSGGENSFRSISPNYSLDDSRSVRRFLKELEEAENKNASLQASVYKANRSNTVDTFWNYYNTAKNMLKTTIYQLAPIEPASAQNKQVNLEDGGTLNSLASNSALLSRIPSDKLSQYVANLRMWISVTILQRIVAEIDNANALFRQRGFVDLQIGGVGLDRLRKMTEHQQFISQYMPSLPMLLPYVELCSNQEYLVKRMKELAEGSCIPAFRWNAGGDYNNQKWGDHLPTDSAIIFHLLCTYLDGQLMPLPQGGGRPFYSRYVIIRETGNQLSKEIVSAVQNKARCAILCSNPLKPKFNFISDNQVHNCAFDRNNMFHVLIQFLVYMRTNNDSMLEGVSLGRGGISLMCVIE